MVLIVLAAVDSSDIRTPGSPLGSGGEQPLNFSGQETLYYLASQPKRALAPA